MSFNNFLIVLFVIATIVIVMAQIAKLGDMITNLKKDPEKAEEESSTNLALLFIVSGLLFVGLITWSYFNQQPRFLPEASSELGRDWDWLFYIVFSPPIVLIFFITHALLFWFVYKYSYKKGRVGFYFPESIKLEMIWTVVPAVVMIALVGLGLGKWIKATSPPSEDAMHIRITGMQFKWMINYAGDDGEFGDRDIRKWGKEFGIQNLLGLDPTDAEGYDDIYPDEIVVPVNQEIAFDINALDVLHDFYLPNFRIKMDAVPGVPTRIKIKPDVTTAQMREKLGDPDFEYEIACAELCGTGHWNMKKVLRVVSQEEYDEWLASQATAKAIYYQPLLDKLEKEKNLAMQGADSEETVLN
ncbi:MAG: cytochrome c oxidase subunit II [Saprospiraceae bacterium]|nr:cytochrome c oxidase subunit II [Saprospiraceae bacterium]